MKLLILHGSGLSAISSKISEIKKSFDPVSILEISGKETSFSEALIEIGTGGLFSQSRLIILENFDDKIDIEKIPDDESLTVLLRFTKPLNKSSSLLKSATKLNVQVLVFEENQEISVFPFLDALGEKNKTKSYQEFEKLYKGYGGQYILTMIFYLFRRLVTTPKKLPDFVLNKLNKQKRNFGVDELRLLYKAALETDYKFKSGLMDEKLGLTMLVERILRS